LAVWAQAGSGWHLANCFSQFTAFAGVSAPTKTPRLSKTSDPTDEDAFTTAWLVDAGPARTAERSGVPEPIRQPVKACGVQKPASKPGGWSKQTTLAGKRHAAAPRLGAATEHGGRCSTDR